MRLLSLLLALSLQAVPSAAQGPTRSPQAPPAVEGTFHLGTLDLRTGALAPPNRAPGDIIWDATTASGFFRNQGQTEEVLDEGDLPDGTLVGGFQAGIATDAVGSVTLRYAFYQNNQFNTVGPTFQTLSGNPAVFDVTFSGLPGGGIFAYTLDVLVEDFTITGPDLDSDGRTDWGWGLSIVNPGSASSLGPLITVPGASATGAADLFDVFDPPILTPGTYQGTLFFGGTPFAQFHMQIVEGAPLLALPAMSDAALTALLLLLGVAGMLSLHRR